MSTPSFLSKTFFEADVDGRRVKFYPIGMRTAFRIRGMTAQLFQALQTLFATDRDDVTKARTKVVTKEGDYKEDENVTALSPELAALRSGQKQDAIQKIVDSLLSEDSSFVLAELLIDSMRDEDFPRPPKTQDLAAFVSNVSANCMVEMVMGLVGANKQLFSPLAKWVKEAGGVLKARLADLTQKQGDQSLPQMPKMPTTPS